MTTFLSFLPLWLSGLLTAKFYNACITHQHLKNNDKNFFCFNCCEAICQFCKPLHGDHNILQIRRLSYFNVARVGDLKNILDCSSVRPYFTNGANVVYLKQRVIPARRRTSDTAACIPCDRVRRQCLQYEHCSIFCKVKEIIETGEELSDFVRYCEDVYPPPPGTVVEENRWTPSSVLIQNGSSVNTAESCSTARGGMSCMSLACTATTDAVVRKKRTTVTRSKPVYVPVTGKSCRRKGTPRRSHLA